MRKIILILIFGMLLLSIVLVSANGGHESGIEEGKKLVESNISCNELSDEQLEAIGDYLMEQMHPGESHESMHNIMGGEDSEAVKQMHVNMAKMMYCNNGKGMNNMMNMMSGGMMNGMMGDGMMNMNGNMKQGMMGNFGYLGYRNWYWNFSNVLYMILLIGLVILVCLAILKLLKSSKTKR